MPCLHPFTTKDGYSVPCGKCKECRARLARHWSFRLQKEMDFSLFTFFCTFTYDDEYLPIRESLVSDKGETLEKLHYSKHYYSTPDGVIPLKERFDSPKMATGLEILEYYHNTHDCAVVSKKDCFHFIRSMRNDLRDKGYKFKYWLAAEYGSIRQRPHYHALIFVRDGKLEFWIDFIKKHWVYGLSDVQLANDSAAVNYTNKYMRKLSPTPFGCVKPFRIMSNKLGSEWLDKYGYSLEQLGSNNCFATFPDGSKTSIPRYYRKRLFPNESGLYNDLKVKQQNIKDYEKNKGIAQQLNPNMSDEDFCLQYRNDLDSELINTSTKTPYRNEGLDNQ